MLLSSSYVSVRVFDFDASRSAAVGSPLSSATLTNDHKQSLPQRNILCFSTKLSELDEKSRLVVNGEDNKPWLAFRFFGIILWTETQGGFVEYDILEKPWTHAWKNICADVDAVSGNVSVSLTGREAITKHNEGIKTNKPRGLAGKIIIGICKGKSFGRSTGQFYGSVSNINIHNHKMNVLNSEVSKYHPGNIGGILAWTNMVFELKGNGVSIREAETQYPNRSRQVLLPVKTDWHEGNQFCKHLGKGKMTEFSNKDELNTTVELVKGLTESCTFLWTPVTDESVEGEYRSINSGDKVSFLPWALTNPTGASSANYVALNFEDMSFYDLSSRKFCVSCTMTTTRLFRLRGLCQDSYMGKVNHRSLSVFNTPRYSQLVLYKH